MINNAASHELGDVTLASYTINDIKNMFVANDINFHAFLHEMSEEEYGQFLREAMGDGFDKDAVDSFIKTQYSI